MTSLVQNCLPSATDVFSSFILLISQKQQIFDLKSTFFKVFPKRKLTNDKKLQQKNSPT